MSALLFRTRVAVLWVAVAVAMSGSLLLFLYAPGAVEEMLAGTMEGETLSDAWTFLFAAVGAIPLVMAVVTLLVSDRANRYVNLVAGLAYDDWPKDDYYRFEPDGEATRFVIESEGEMPGRMPGFMKDLLIRGWAERQHRKILADFKALAEANVPAHVQV